MNQINPKNERIKCAYFQHQLEANRKSVATIDQIRKAIDRFEKYNKLKDFATFNKEQAIAFKHFLKQQKSERKNELLSKATVLSTLNVLKEFLKWIAYLPGYKSKIHIPDIEYLNLSDKEISIAKAESYKTYPSIEQIKHVLSNMPTATDINRRDRALMALTILTGMRDAALASLRLVHVKLNTDPIMIFQNPDLVETKFSKQIYSHILLNDEPEIIEMFGSWIKELREEKLYSDADPVFPSTKLGHDENNSFVANGLQPVCWQSAAAIRKIFKTAFENCGLPYFSPHRFRDTLAHLADKYCTSPAQLKAWSQSLGHKDVLTTITSYGYLNPHQQGEILKGLKKPGLEMASSKYTIDDIINEIRKRDA